MDCVKKNTDELIIVLEQEIRLLGSLDGFALEKEPFIIQADTENLNVVLLKEEETVLALRELEKQRETRVKTLADSLRLQGENLTLKDLTEQMENQECRRRLMSAGRKMNQAMRKLSKHNEKEKSLLMQQIRYTDYMLDTLCGPPDGSRFYNIQGNMEEKAGPISRLDYHV